MKRILLSIIVLTAMMVPVGCDKPTNDAQRLVKEFLKDNLKNADFKILDFSKVNSTSLISDSIFHAMRDNATKNSLFKKDIQYADGPKTDVLKFIRVKYKVDKDTCQQTFYLDEQLTRVVSLKTD